MKNTLILFAVGIVVIGGLIWVSRNQDNGGSNGANLSALSGGVLKAEETNYDFGNISMAAGKVKHLFSVKNTGTGALAITKVYTSCMCTSAMLINGSENIGPFGMAGHGFIPTIKSIVDTNGEAALEITFDPAAHGPAGVGKIARTVTVENTTGDPLEFNFSAFVTP